MAICQANFKCDNEPTSMRMYFCLSNLFACVIWIWREWINSSRKF